MMHGQKNIKSAYCPRPEADHSNPRPPSLSPEHPFSK